MVADAPKPRRRAAIVFVAALLAAGLTARLGVWQLSRANQKQAWQISLDDRSAQPPVPAADLARSESESLAQHHRRVRLRGEWMGAATVFLENRQMNGRPGFYVVTPLRLEDGSAVLVQRGWGPRDLLDRTRVPVVASPAGPIEVEGRIAPPPGRLYDFAGAAPGAIRQNLDLALFSAEINVPLRPVSLLQTGGPQVAGDGLLREWPAPATGLHRHHGYAFQWFALSALITGLYVWFQVIRPRFTASRQQREDPA